MPPPSPLRRPAAVRGQGSMQDQVLACLRMEIQEQGALLGLFAEQQKSIIQRESDRVMMLVDAIQQQIELVHRVRSRREIVVASLVPRSRVSRTTRLSDLVTRFPAPMQPMLRALTDELLRLADHVRRKANQNQMLLARSIEVIRDLLEELTPSNPARTYENDGRVKISLKGTAAAYKS
jgi:flagellar biosynthesis/type III secretory pathway chaperone